MKEEGRGKIAALEQQDEGSVLQVLCPRLPRAPSSLPRGLGSHLLILTGDTRYVFPILHVNVTIVLLRAGTQVDSEALAGRRGKVGAPLPASTLRYGTQKPGGGLVWVTHGIGVFCSEQSRHLLKIYSPTAHPEKDDHEDTAMGTHINSTKL